MISWQKSFATTIIGSLAIAGCIEYPSVDTIPFDTDEPGDTDSVTSTETDCVSQALMVCHDGDVHWQDSCGNIEDVATSCSPERSCAVNNSGEPTCACSNSWTGDTCEICPGNWNPAADCGACQPGWAGEDCQTCARFVDAANITGALDGLGWEAAFGTVQAGIDAAAQVVQSEVAIDRCSVWVKAGTYHIYENAVTDSVVLGDGVDLFGGFAGDEQSPGDRNLSLYSSVLDGQHRTDPTQRVATVVTVDVDAVIDGFEITGGLDDPGDLEWREGAGMRITNSSPTIRSCTFHGNAAQFGGAVFAEHALPRFVDCEFVQNEAYMSGGAILARDCARVEIENSLFKNNTAEFRGGALSLHDVTEAECHGCTFEGNLANSGPVVEGADLEHLLLENALIYDNLVQPTSLFASVDGAGMVLEVGVSQTATSTRVDVVNSTIVENRQSTGTQEIAHLAAGGDLELHVTNSIVWGNANPEACFPAAAQLEMTSSALDCTDASGDGVIDINPQFVNSAGGNFALSAGSPCIDAADGSVAPEYDLLGAARVSDPQTPFSGAPNADGIFVDMGAYEFHPI